MIINRTHACTRVKMSLRSCSSIPYSRRHTQHHAMRTTSIGSIAAASRRHSCLADGAVCHVQRRSNTASHADRSQPPATARRGPALRVRRGQASRCTSSRTETISGCKNARAGGGQRSADEEARAVHDLVAGATTTRQRAQTGIAESLKRVPAHRVDTPRQRVDIF